MNPNTRRVFYTCSRKSCTIKHTVDYRVTPSGQQFGTFNGARYPRPMLERMLARCACGGYIQVTELKKTVKTDHVCNSRCMGSTSGVCECSCEGANHGGQHLTVAA